MSREFMLFAERFGNPAGTTVYEYVGHDYGLCRGDVMESGKDHYAVTLDPNGATPFFTVPTEDLEAFDGKPIPPNYFVASSRAKNLCMTTE